MSSLEKVISVLGVDESRIGATQTTPDNIVIRIQEEDFLNLINTIKRSKFIFRSIEKRKEEILLLHFSYFSDVLSIDLITFIIHYTDETLISVIFKNFPSAKFLVT